MTFKKLVGLAAIGGLLYAHKKRGGQFTIESFKQSGRELMDGAKDRFKDMRMKVDSRLHEAKSRMADATDVSPRGSTREEVGYGTSGFGYSGNRQR